LANDFRTEFYNTSQYGREYVIGRNCRFLQGPKTSNASVRRLIDALAAGQEVTETILNYRRDGSPFMNLLLIAPLYDNKGNVRYFLGCQIDVSSLIEGGRGLESFANLLARDRSESRFGDSLQKDPKHMLGEFGAVLTDEEANIVKNRTRSFSEGIIRPGTAMSGSVRAPRRRLGMDDNASDRNLWPHASLGPSGRLPGVYQNVSHANPKKTPNHASSILTNTLKNSTSSSAPTPRSA
jgi:PAS domain S-box-containing protein